MAWARLHTIPQALALRRFHYPDYYPIVTYCEDREVAKELTRLFDNRAADKNVKILERVLVLEAGQERRIRDVLADTREADGG